MALPLCIRRHLSFLEGVIEQDLAIHIFDAIMLQFEPSQLTDCGYYPVTLIRLMREDLLDEYNEQIGPGQDLSHLAPFPHLPSEQKDTLREIKVLAGKTPQPIAALSRSTTADVAIGTLQRISNLYKSCFIRDWDRRDVKNDNGKLLLPKCDTMAYLEKHIIANHLSIADLIKTESKQIADRVLTIFNPGAIYLIDGVDINRLINALTLTVDLHRLFGNFEIPFEPVSTQPHTYKVDYVESGRMGRVEKLPVTVGLFLTPDRKEMKGGKVIHDRSTYLNYVWFRLRETSVY
ncbi:uncharacterized protein BO80DRAFT_451870 [Aspergillus ibericus CBS 121593]|uniref:Uncharacterized protein n=1 Tax=Aspergillus ibericus CBS 121593 TaxID=1448316 RepID=A0A395HF96_9EURO|nr:hypothetical protein BO80DRAFT_451870 [Aspergillus ibericus CBS 121593]RAL04904.1 hypothetical protein BO80DRAFT_451870 [Aspergillus ibericus CBS 121593]